MKCKECVQECKDAGGFCNPVSSEEDQMLAEVITSHRLGVHVMPVIGGSYRCPKGLHPLVEAHGADAMRAAGMEPII